MKIIKPDVQFITPIDGATILKRLEQCGRVCYKSEDIIRDEDEQQKRVNTLIFVLKYITRLAGFELLNRIEIKDRKTGREYR